MILVPLSKVPSCVVLDVLDRIHRHDLPNAATTSTGNKTRISAAIVRQFMSDCMHQSQSGPGAKVTDVIERLQAWGNATGRWTSVLPSPRQLVAILNELGISIYSAHRNCRAISGWKLN